MSWRGKDNIKAPTRKANREEQRCVHVVPLVAQMPFIFGACPSSFQEISPYPVSMGKYSVTLQPFRHERLRTESGHEVKPVFIIQDMSRARSLEQAALSWKTKRYSKGPQDDQESPVQSCGVGSAGLHHTEELDGEMHRLTATRHTSPLPRASHRLSEGLGRGWAKLPSAKFRLYLESLLSHLVWFLVERPSFYYTSKSMSDNIHHCYFYRIKAWVPFAISDFSLY